MENPFKTEQLARLSVALERLERALPPTLEHQKPPFGLSMDPVEQAATFLEYYVDDLEMNSGVFKYFVLDRATMNEHSFDSMAQAVDGIRDMDLDTWSLSSASNEYNWGTICQWPEVPEKKVA